MSVGPAPPWRPDTPEPVPAGGPAARHRHRARRLLILLVAIAFLGGAALAWLLLPRGFEEPFFLSIPVTEYQERALPGNAWAVKDSAALRRHFPNSRADVNFQERHLLKAALYTLRGNKAPAVVVHLSAHAVHRDGRVFILPGNAALDKPNTWLDLENDVLAPLRDCPSPNPNRLLILDVTPPAAGVLADHLHAQLEGKRGGVGAGPVLVLCACGPGQVPLASDVAGLSAFAYFLDEGLSGRADGYKGGRADRRVTVGELAAYVTDRVDQWAPRNRGVGQKPALLGTGPDFELVALSGR